MFSGVNVVVVRTSVEVDDKPIRASRREKSQHCSVAKRKNATELASHQRVCDFPCRSKRQRVVDMIVHSSAVIGPIKGVAMFPARKRPGELLVSKIMWRLPVADKGLPAKTHPPKPEAVANMGAFPDPTPRRHNDRKVELRGRDALEVSRIREKRKQILRRLRQCDCRIEAMLHGDLPHRWVAKPYFRRHRLRGCDQCHIVRTILVAEECNQKLVARGSHFC